MSVDPLDLRKVSVDSLITQTKLSGSVTELRGHTTPEGWPFIVVVAVEKPGNGPIVALARQFSAQVAEAAPLAAAIVVPGRRWP